MTNRVCHFELQFPGIIYWRTVGIVIACYFTEQHKRSLASESPSSLSLPSPSNVSVFATLSKKRSLSSSNQGAVSSRRTSEEVQCTFSLVFTVRTSWYLTESLNCWCICHSVETYSEMHVEKFLYLSISSVGDRLDDLKIVEACYNLSGHYANIKAVVAHAALWAGACSRN